MLTGVPTPPDQDHWRSLFDAAGVGFAITTLDGRFVHSNPALHALIGRSGSELARANILDLAPTADRVRLRTAVRSLLDGDVTSAPVEVRLHTPSGELRHLRCAMSLVREEDGRPTHVMGTVEDLTAEADTATHQHRNRSLWRMAASVARVGGWELDVATDVIQWSPEVRDLLKVPAGARVTLRDALAATARQHHAVVRAALQDCRERGVPFDIEVRATSRLGDPLWVRVTGEAERGADGEVRRLLGALQDVTDSRREARERHALNERLTRTFESIDDAVIVLDGTWRCTYVNQQAATLFEGTSHPILGTEIWDFLPDLVGTDGEQVYRRVAREQAPETIDEFHAPSMDRWFRIDVHPVDDGVTVHFRDITEQRQVASHLMRVQRMENVGAMTSGLAHDLQNTLALVEMSATTLAHGEDDEGRLEILDVLQRNARRSTEMLRTLLQQTRRTERTQAFVDLADLVRDIGSLAGSGIQWRTEAASDLWPVIGDPTQLHQLVLNLCVNARDAMPDGGMVHVAVDNAVIDGPVEGAHGDVVPGRHVVLTVADSGTGMTPEVMEHAFDPFWTTKGEDRGTGLGLPTTLAIVRGHGGFLQVDSTLGEGTTFTVHLPASSWNEVPATTP